MDSNKDSRDYRHLPCFDKSGLNREDYKNSYHVLRSESILHLFKKIGEKFPDIKVHYSICSGDVLYTTVFLCRKNTSMDALINFLKNENIYIDVLYSDNSQEDADIISDYIVFDNNYSNITI